MANITSTLTSWSTTAASNQPDGTDTLTLAADLQQIQAVVRQLAASNTIASSGTTDLSTVNEAFITVSGTTTITALGTLSAGMYKWLHFSGALTLTHNGTSLILPYAANITTTAGDCGLFLSLGSGNWRCLSWLPVSASAARTLLGLAIGTDVQAYDADLAAIAALASNGIIARTGSGTVAARTITAPAAGITVADGDGVSGNPTLALANDLSAVEGLATTGLVRRTGADTWTAGTTVATAEIADDAVTYGKIQDITATSRIIGRKTAGAGVAEECTLSEILDFIGSAAQGDILYRGAASWSRLGAGTSGQFLKTQGAGANPAWDSAGGSPTIGDFGTINLASDAEWTTVPADAKMIVLSINLTSLSSSGADLQISFGRSAGYDSTNDGYYGTAGGASVSHAGGAYFTLPRNGTDGIFGANIICFLGDSTNNIWSASGTYVGATSGYYNFTNSRITMSGALTKIKIAPSAGTMSGNVYYYVVI